jgi:hypothetical protein
MMGNDKERKKKIRRDAILAMAIVFATVSIWKGFSGIIDLMMIKGSSSVVTYFGCIILGLVILGTMHYSVRNFINQNG